MDYLENIQWYIASDPNTATNKNKSFKKLTKKELNMVVFDHTKESVKLAFPLNDNYSFCVTREIKCPVTIGSLFKLASISNQSSGISVSSKQASFASSSNSSL